MSTIRDIIVMALAKISVFDPTPDEVARAITSFNFMVSGWRMQGIDIWRASEAIGDGLPVPEINFTDFDAAAPFPMPDAFRKAAANCLAEDLAPEYGKQFSAGSSLRQIQAGYAVDRKVRMPAILFASNARRHPRQVF